MTPPNRIRTRPLKQRVRTAKQRSAGSARWLQRQLNDPYVADARVQGYRSRAAFKLREIDDRFAILKPGRRVLDLGAAPGGWTQVAVARTGATADTPRVVALDIKVMDPLAGALIITGDFEDDAAVDRAVAALGGPADILLSDMAGAASGHKHTDSLRVLALCESAAAVTDRVLAPGGTFLCKLIRGADDQPFRDSLKTKFADVRLVKPPASRTGSAEIYLLCRSFKPD